MVPWEPCAGCFWSIEVENDQRFVEITIEKGADEQWKQILESDSSASAKAKVTDWCFVDIEEVRSQCAISLDCYLSGLPCTSCCR